MSTTVYPRIRLVIGGVIAGVQTWSVGVSTTSTDIPPTQADFTTWLDSLVASLTACWSAGPGVAASGDTQLTRLSAYHYDANARIASRVAETPVGPLGGHASGSNSYRDCLVASLMTATPGKSGRGRMYWPATGAAITNHQAGSSLVSDMATQIALFLNAINASSVGPVPPTVIVAGKISPPPPVIQVAVDTKLDSQENRSDKIAAFDRAIGVL